MQITPVVKQLLIINIIFFLGSQFVPLANDMLALHYPESDGFYFWQILTHMFMHGSVMHILFNMLGLYSFGSALEHFWGGKKFLFFYISCGLGSALLYTAFNYYEFHQGYNLMIANGFSPAEIKTYFNGGSIPLGARPDINQEMIKPAFEAYYSRAVGASGALYGLMTAFAFMFPNAELIMIFLPIPIKAKYFVPLLLTYDLIGGFYGKSVFGGDDGIAHFGHIGGALVGFIMMWYWKKNQFNDRRWN